MDSLQTFDVREAGRGKRLDRFLAERLRLSRSQVRRLLARGAVQVDGRAVGESAKGLALQPEAVVEVAPFSRPENQRALPAPDMNLSILAEGTGWLAIDKPAGVPVHPFREDETGTLLNALIARCPEVHGVGEGGLGSGVVHRLDVDTSGVVLLATCEEVWQKLRAAFREHRFEKCYRALVLGVVEGEGVAEVGLAVARHRPARVRIVDESERERARGVWVAGLRWRSLKVLRGATLLEVRPRTGFLHQIRATLAHLGFPVAGDRTYGPAGDSTGAQRHMLHAARLTWGEIDAASSDPADFEALLDRLQSPH